MACALRATAQASLVMLSASGNLVEMPCRDRVADTSPPSRKSPANGAPFPEIQEAAGAAELGLRL
jgi:hypothetical protein